MYPLERIFGTKQSSSSSSSSSTSGRRSLLFGGHPQTAAIQVQNGVVAAATQVQNGVAAAAGQVQNGVAAAATQVQNGVVVAAEHLQSGAVAAAEALHTIILLPETEQKKTANPTLLSHFNYTLKDKIILSDDLSAATVALMKEYSLKVHPTYNDEFINIWQPDEKIVNDNLAILAKAQDLMCSQIFSSHRNISFDKSNEELAYEYSMLGTHVTSVLTARKANTAEIFKNEIKASDIYQNFNAYGNQIADLYSSIMPGPITALATTVQNIKKAKFLPEESRKFLDVQIKSISSNVQELSVFIDAISNDIDAELNSQNHVLSLYEDQRATYANQSETLKNIHRILQTIISHENTDTDPMAHCITPDQYKLIHENPRTPYIEAQASKNIIVDDIAHSMIIIEPGIDAIRAGINKQEDHMVSTLLESAVRSMLPFLSEMSTNVSEQGMSLQKTCYQLATYIGLIDLFYDAVPILSSHNYHLIYRQKEYAVSTVLREGISGEIEAFIPASKLFKQAIGPIKEKTEAFLISLADEVNHLINGVDEGSPGFLKLPSKALAENIVEKLKCFKIVMDAYQRFIQNDNVVQNLSQFNVNGENLSTSNEVINKLFDIFTKSITYHIDASKFDETKVVLISSVEGYTTLYAACKVHHLENKPDVLDIRKAANDIKDRYVQKLKLIEDIEAFAVIQHIVEYSNSFYIHIAGPLNIDWLSTEELLLELIEIFINNPSYMTRDAETQQAHHREMHGLIRILLQENPQLSDIYKRIFHINGAEDTPNECLNLQIIKQGNFGDESKLEMLFTKVITLVLRNNPFVHVINLDKGLRTRSMLLDFLKINDQADTYIFKGFFTYANWELGEIMQSAPGIKLEPCNETKDISDHVIETTVRRTRPLTRSEPAAIIETVDIDDVGSSLIAAAGNTAAVPDASVSNNNNMSKTIKKKAAVVYEATKLNATNLKQFVNREVEEFKKDKLTYVKHALFYEAVDMRPASGPTEESKVDSNDLSPHIRSAQKKVNDIFWMESDKAIYDKLVEHRMNPTLAFKCLQENTNFTTFNGVAIRILGLSPSIEFIAGMARLSLAQGDVVQASKWTDHLHDRDDFRFVMLARDLIIHHGKTLIDRNEYIPLLNNLITKLAKNPNNMMPHDYVKLINSIYDSSQHIGFDMMSLIESYLSSRACLNDFNDIESLNNHYDLLLRYIENVKLNKHLSLFNALLKSDVYGRFSTRNNLSTLISKYSGNFAANQIKTTLSKVENFNLMIANHVKNKFMENEININNAVHFDNHMMVLISNRQVASTSPLHETDNSDQNERDRAFIIGLIYYLHNFKSGVNFSEHAQQYISHLLTLNITDNEMSDVISAVTQLSLANMRNIENKLVCIVEMIADQFSAASGDLMTQINALKNTAIDRQLIKVMGSFLFHFNATLLPTHEIKNLRKAMINIMNDQDSKSLPKSLSEITKTYRNDLGSEACDFDTIKSIRLDIDFMIGFCSRIKSMTAQEYSDAHHTNVMMATRVGLSRYSAEINSRLAPLISSLEKIPSERDIDALTIKLNGMYSKIMEILVMNSLPALKDPNDLTILITMIQQRKNNGFSAEAILSSARATAGIQSSYSMKFSTQDERGIVKLLKAINSAMIENMDPYTINMLHRCVSHKIQKSAGHSSKPLNSFVM